MEIIKSNTAMNLEQRKNGDFLTTILDSIFAISKNDKNFSVRDKSDKISNKIGDLTKKINEKQTLLDKALMIEKNTLKTLKDYEEQNTSLKTKLLEILGGE